MTEALPRRRPIKLDGFLTALRDVLESRQIDDDVEPDVLPRDHHRNGRHGERWIGEPRHRRNADRREQRVDQPDVGGIEGVPENRHHRAGDHHGEKERGAPERAEPHGPVERDREAECGNDLKGQMNAEEDKRVADRLPEARVCGEQPEVVRASEGGRCDEIPPHHHERKRERHGIRSEREQEQRVGQRQQRA